MTASPSPALLRELTDQLVLRALMDAARLTRAELAVVCGLAKPTTAEAVRRLVAAGLVADTGERTTGRGGVGTYYALAADAGTALAVGIAPDGIVAELLDARGTVRSRATRDVERPGSPGAIRRLLTGAVRSALRPALQSSPTTPVRVAAVSAADPVDRVTGGLVPLPDAPFLLGKLSPAAVLRPFVAGAVRVDNDVNWAARAERAARRARGGPAVDDFVYLHLGEGLGCAVTTDGEVVRGHRGVAGEIAHVLTADARGRAVPFTEVFGQLGLRHPGSTAIDVERVRRVLADRRRGPVATRTLAGAVCGVLAAATGLCDPGLVVLGGPWSDAAPLLDEVRRQLAGSPRPVPVEAARATDEPSLAGVRQASVLALRDDLVALTRAASG